MWAVTRTTSMGRVVIRGGFRTRSEAVFWMLDNTDLNDVAIHVERMD